jgi:hypothetical protein
MSPEIDKVKKEFNKEIQKVRPEMKHLKNKIKKSHTSSHWILS